MKKYFLLIILFLVFPGSTEALRCGSPIHHLYIACDEGVCLNGIFEKYISSGNGCMTKSDEIVNFAGFEVGQISNEISGTYYITGPISCFQTESLTFIVDPVSVENGGYGFCYIERIGEFSEFNVLKQKVQSEFLEKKQSQVLQTSILIFLSLLLSLLPSLVYFGYIKIKKSIISLSSLVQINSFFVVGFLLLSVYLSSALWEYVLAEILLISLSFTCIQVIVLMLISKYKKAPLLKIPNPKSKD